MTTEILALTLIIGVTFALVILILLVGYFSTISLRLNHQREMFKLHEAAKVNAVEIQARQADILTDLPLPQRPNPGISERYPFLR